MESIIKNIVLLFTLVFFAYSQDTQTVTISLNDGSQITGSITSETEVDYTVETISGIVMTIPKDIVTEIETYKGVIKEGKK